MLQNAFGRGSVIIKQKYIKARFKILAIRSATNTLRVIASATKKLPVLATYLKAPLNLLGRFLLWSLVLPLYKVYTIWRKVLTRLYAPQHSRHHLLHTFSRRFLTHAIIIIISIFIVGSNLNASEVRRDNLAQKSIAATLVEPDLGTLETEGPITETTKVTRYLGQTGVKSEPQGDTQTQEIIPSTTAGGSAVLQPIISPLEQELRQRDKVITYTVQPGDTISQIAGQFGVTINTILWENNLTSYTLIRPGDTLNILPTSGIVHKVKSGETITKIATTYEVDENQIIEFNKLASADDINVGESLVIPGGAKIAPKPTYTVTAPRQTYIAPAPAPRVVSTGSMVWPTTCRHITQYYRWQHSGVDIACKMGDPIYAADAGTVVTSQGGYNGGYGIYVIIDHGNGKQTLYGHASKLYVSVGDTVEKGDLIAAMGSTGRSTGPHVHFEIRSGGARQNPLSYIK